LPQAAVVSIAHREAVAKFHQLRWQFAAPHSAQHTMEPAPVDAPYAIQCSRIVMPPARVVGD
jgi:hypothetical protein